MCGWEVGSIWGERGIIYYLIGLVGRCYRSKVGVLKFGKVISIYELVLNVCGVFIEC